MNFTEYPHILNRANTRGGLKQGQVMATHQFILKPLQEATSRGFL